MTWPHRLTIVLTCTLLTAIAPLAHAPAQAQADDELLAEERWSESAFGLSLRPPAEAQSFQQTHDEAIVTFRVGDEMTMRLYFRQTEEPVTLDLVRERAADQFTFYHPSAVVVKDDAEEVRIADRRGGRWYFVIPDDEGEWIAGQAFMLIDPYTIALFQYESEAHSYERSRRLFEAVLDSVELMPPEELDAQRTALVEAGDAWLADVDMAQVERVLPERQFRRVLRDGEDIGYQRLTTERVEHLGEPGLRLRLQSRNMADDNRAFDSEQELFLAEQGPMELWSVVTTLRPASGQGRGPTGFRSQSPRSRQAEGQQTWTDTGLRSRDRISVSREGASEIDSRDWEVPPKAYLPQLMIHAAPALMAEQAAGGRPPEPMAFYAYDIEAGRLLLRTMRIEPANDDGWHVFDRPAPDRPEQVFHFDADAELLERRGGDGRVFQPATREQIRRIWDE